HAQTTTKYVELIIVADNREVSRGQTSHHPLHLPFYRALNIRVALVGLEVWSDVDKCPITQDPFTTLHEFLDWRKVKLLPQKPHDNAQLIRYCSIEMQCFLYSQLNKRCLVVQLMDHSDNPLGAAVTLAHELGHNFGMNHDTPERGCGCRVTVDRGGCIMTPSTGYFYETVLSYTPLLKACSGKNWHKCLSDYQPLHSVIESTGKARLHSVNHEYRFFFISLFCFS
uniref:ADAM metallopeptidase domain 12 n=1 Tax=Pundamilia nyererei TaxID=303518 RepID=A0A3B4F034_9CICH